MAVMSKYQDLLFRAIEDNQIEAIGDLLEAGASITVPRLDGLTPLDFAHELGRNDILKKFFESVELSTVDLNNPHHINLIMVACDVGDAFISLWIEYGLSVNVTNSTGETPLHFVMRYFDQRGSVEALSLISRGADPRMKNIDGQTPLHYLVSNHQEDPSLCMFYFVRATIFDLVRRGVDINARDSLGRSPLLVAKFGKDFNCFFTLLRFGSDVNVEDNTGSTVFDHILNKLRDNNCFELDVSREVKQIEKELYGPTRVLVYHVIKIREIGLNVSEKIQSKIGNLIQWLNFMHEAGIELSEIYVTFDEIRTEDIDSFTLQCRMEVKKLKEAKLENSIVLETILTKSDYEMSNLVKKEQIKGYFDSGQYKSDFPNYYFLLELRYRAGIIRNLILPIAENVLKSSTQSAVHSSEEFILQGSTNLELIDIISTMFLSSPHLGPHIQQEKPLHAILMAEIENFPCMDEIFTPPDALFDL